MKQTEKIIEIFLAAISCVVEDGKAIYASTPITNGPILLEHSKSNPDFLRLNEIERWKYVKQNVVPANVTKAKIFAERLRGMGLIVIDPSSFFSETMSQEEYLKLWCTVIKRFAGSVWLNEGWSFSIGCTTEYCIAIENGIPTFDCIGNHLPVEEAMRLLTSSATQLKNAGLVANALENQIGKLNSFKMKS